MDFVYIGNNGYESYAYVYQPTRAKLEEALARVVLRNKGIKPTRDNIRQQIQIIQEQDLIDTTDIVEENYEEIKEVLRKNANLDL